MKKKNNTPLTFKDLFNDGWSWEISRMILAKIPKEGEKYRINVTFGTYNKIEKPHFYFELWPPFGNRVQRSMYARYRFQIKTVDDYNLLKSHIEATTPEEQNEFLLKMFESKNTEYDDFGYFYPFWIKDVKGFIARKKEWMRKKKEEDVEAFKLDSDKVLEMPVYLEKSEDATDTE